MNQFLAVHTGFNQGLSVADIHRVYNIPIPEIYIILGEIGDIEWHRFRGMVGS